MQQRAGLRGERVGHRRVGVAERGDGQAGQEVEVLAGPRRPRAGCPRPARRSPAGAGRCASGGCRDGRRHGRHHRSDSFAGEESRASRAWATRPSRMWARATPSRTACRQDATLGIMPSPTRAVGEQGRRARRRAMAEISVDGVVAVPPEALDVGQVDQLGWRRAPRRWRRPPVSALML